MNYYLLAHRCLAPGHAALERRDIDAEDLAAKHKSTVATMAARHKAKVITGNGPRTCRGPASADGKKDLIARFGGIALKRDKRAVITDPAPVPVDPPRKELIGLVPRRWCEVCDHGATVTVHHVARLAQLGTAGRASQRGRPSWPGNGARPSSSAAPATTTSTRAPSRTRHSH